MRYFRSPILYVVLVALLLRFGLLFAFNGITNFDLYSYEKIGQLTLQHIPIYPLEALKHHPYFPFFLYIESLAVYLASYGISAIFTIKTILILFDIGILCLVYLLSKKSTVVALLYALNPISILTVAVHGQFDAIPLFFLLFGVYMFLERREVGAVLLLSLAVMVKTWPLFFIWPMVRRMKQRWQLLLLLTFPLLAVFVYSRRFYENIFDIFSTVFSYHGYSTHWGIGMFISMLGLGGNGYILIIIKMLFVVTFIYFCLTLKKGKIIHEMALLFLFFYSFSYGMGLQYFSWIIPFLLLDKPKLWRCFIVLVTFHFLLQYPRWILCIQCNDPALWVLRMHMIYAMLLWIFIVYMWFVNLRK